MKKAAPENSLRSTEMGPFPATVSLYQARAATGSIEVCKPGRYFSLMFSPWALSRWSCAVWAAPCAP